MSDRDQSVNLPHESGTRRRRALVIACNFPPDASVGTMRTLRLIRQIESTGWFVDVLTAHPGGYRPGTVTDVALLARVPASARVFRVRARRPIDAIGRMLGRGWRRQRSALVARGPSSDLSRSRASAGSIFARVARACLMLPDRENGWFVPAVLKGISLVRATPPDVVLSSGPPFIAHLVAAAVSGASHVPWVAEFRDPWARAPWRDDRFAFEKRVWDICERLVVTRADRLVFVTDTNRAEFVERYGAALRARTRVVQNGCDLGEFDGVIRTQAADAPFTLVHVGSLYGARDPEPLLNATARAIARGAIDGHRFRIRFIGRAGIPHLHAVSDRLGLGSIVEFVTHVPRREALQAMVDASALLVLQPVTTVSVPAKVYEYMAAGPPILALAEPAGETARVVGGHPRGIAVPAYDEGAIERALVELVQAARGSTVPVDPGLCDGTRRAADVEAQLIAAIEGRGLTCPDEREALA